MTFKAHLQEQVGEGTRANQDSDNVKNLHGTTQL